MYLTRKSSIWGKFNQETKRYETSVKIEGVRLLSEVIPPQDFGTVGMVDVISENAAYWRKSNQIHSWFVEHIQNGEDECRPHEVSIEQLQELVDTCKQVLANHDLAESLLPAQEGFFFGGTDYDEWYFKDLEDTIKQLEPLIAFEKKLEAEQKEGEPREVWVYYEYRSSW